MNNINPKDMELVIFSPSMTKKDHELYKYYVTFFNEWKTIWLNAYRLMGASPEKLKLYSDEISKKDEIVALFYKGKLVGGATNRIYDFDNVIDNHASYFSNWNDILVKKVSNILSTRKILACGDFTIASDFNTKNSDFPWKGLVLAILLERSLMQEQGPLISCTNSSKKVGEASEKVGARMIISNQRFNFSNGASENVDIMTTNPSLMQNLRETNPLFQMATKLIEDSKRHTYLKVDKKYIEQGTKKIA